MVWRYVLWSCDLRDLNCLMVLLPNMSCWLGGWCDDLLSKWSDKDDGLVTEKLHEVITWWSGCHTSRSLTGLMPWWNDGVKNCSRDGPLDAVMVYQSHCLIAWWSDEVNRTWQPVLLHHNWSPKSKQFIIRILESGRFESYRKKDVS